MPSWNVKISVLWGGGAVVNLSASNNDNKIATVNDVVSKLGITIPGKSSNQCVTVGDLSGISITDTALTFVDAKTLGFTGSVKYGTEPIILVNLTGKTITLFKGSFSDSSISMQTGTFTIFTPNSVSTICTLRPDLQGYTIYHTNIENSNNPNITTRILKYETDISMSLKYICDFYYCY